MHPLLLYFHQVQVPSVKFFENPFTGSPFTYRQVDEWMDGHTQTYYTKVECVYCASTGCLNLKS